jgi:hypothetical protein
LQYAYSHYGSQASYIVLSDFFVDQDALLKIHQPRFETSFLQVISPVERQLPYKGEIAMADVETGEIVDFLGAQSTLGQVIDRMVYDFGRSCQRRGIGHLLLQEDDSDLMLAQALVKFFVFRLSQSL